MNIEPLESRIAPAAVFVTYTDLDGDLVKITATKFGAVAPPLDPTDLTFVGGGAAGQLATLDLTAAAFDGAKIVFTVTKKPGGDGLAHVGFINAANVDLDRVVLKGDLGKIVAGDMTTSGDPGLNALTARSMGTLGLETQGGMGNLSSFIRGTLGALKVTGDFTDALLQTLNASDGRIGSIFIGGSLVGGDGASSGRILSAAGMGDMRIAGDVVGAAGADSGNVFSNGSVGRVLVGGDVIGGAGAESGRVFASNGVAGVSIGGDVIGGAGMDSGEIASAGAMGNVRIGGDLVGGSVTGADSLFDSGQIVSSSRIASVTLGGSLIAGSDASTGFLTRCGAIIARDELGPVKIAGSILGSSDNAALIIAHGQAVKPTTGFDTAIASLTVGGDVRFARILAGFNSLQMPVNADAAIGAVNVGRDWAASSLVAGAEDTGADGFGINDSLQTTGNTGLIARIASVTIAGAATGSFAAGDHFGFVAQQIDKLRIGARPFLLAPGPSNDNAPILFTNDVRLLEV